MTWLEAALLGVVQGLTEFLPVSSDGHLSLVQMLLPRFRQVGVLFDVLTHVGTLAAIVFYFRRVLAEEVGALVSGPPPRRLSAAKLAGLVVLASIPTAVIGLLLKPTVEWMKTDPRMVGGLEIATGLAVASWAIPWRGPRRERDGMRATDAIAMGVAQGLAVLPGLSRSATTIAVGLAVGLAGPWAARFSLYAAIPAILGAAALELVSAWSDQGGAFFRTPDFARYLAGAAVAAIVGFATIGWLLRLASTRRVALFALYCVVLGLSMMAIGWTRAFP